MSSAVSPLSAWWLQACRMEVLSPKPGNVSPGREFSDASTRDFLLSAESAAAAFSGAGRQSVGRTVLEAVRAVRQVVSHNTNLGIILLIAPLAAVPLRQSLEAGIESVLAGLTIQDSRDVYAAIRLAAPGGLGSAEEQDVAAEPSQTLRECMRLSADRDLIALQYADGFRDVLGRGREWLREAAVRTADQRQQVVELAVRLLAEFGDSLIARKCGAEVSERAAVLARRVLQAGWPDGQMASAAMVELDTFLRGDGHRRNPGTTADMTAAILFAALRDGQLIMAADQFELAGNYGAD
ncbi:MAG: triphosphoribosyl-dephospho-CoA synthase [Planctomycetaceae bacterium]